MPVEILIEIFALCATPTDPHAPLTLGSVSSLWRQVVQSSPRIWQNIFLNDRRTIAASHTQAMLWMRQSHPLPFDVHLDVSQSSGLVLPLLSPLLSVINRWRSYTMTGKHEEFADLSDSPHHIDSLVITIQEPDHVDVYDPRHTFALAEASRRGGGAVNIWTPELPKAPSMVPLQFTSIDMSEFSLSILTQPRSILEFLSACPRVETFNFTGWLHEDERLATPLPVAQLPYLRTLCLRNTCGARSILSYIDAPRLSELYLQHLNVDIELSSRGYMHEDGDSDDDANDFSRSRWSDHATGMGLRRLIQRSDPPLRVLEMDWSDMRTKDFRFVFSRLGALERFFIEASDMSDKVVELLRPFTLGQGQPRVRLPRLQRLELSNCNELSGDVLIDVLRARVRLTDRLPAWEGNTLKEVIISDCPGFKGQHAELLRKELGDRVKRDLD
ncbi:hypothetical protein GGX14DRAFT_361982 [Mycena pura]|uniref:F-box domain-containing protein n=1 Tax=Mycena pura TaxID=153505 RepID=A0AAD6VK68_9AGAR|nr:hypothetical protein GGX14DRAFT_361982 [Mycena pura]